MSTDPKPNLWTALIAARAEIPALVKSADNPFFHSKYVPLDEILEACLPILRKHGLYAYGRCEAVGEGGALSVIRDKNDKDAVVETARGLYVTAIVYAETGEVIEDRRPFVGIESAQNTGAFSSYSFRYGLSSLLALEQNDDDGNTLNRTGSAQGRTASQPPRPATPSGQAPKPSGSGAPKKSAYGAVVCPKCHVSGAIIPGKPEFGGGWLCWKRATPDAGCGAQFTSDPLTWDNGLPPKNPFKAALAEVGVTVDDPNDPPPMDDSDLPF